MMTVENLTYDQTLSQLLQGLFHVSNQDDVNVTGITSDSRKVTTGDLFIAYKNPAVIDYVKSAIDSGASAIVAEVDQFPDIPKHNVPVISLPQLGAQAGLIAARFFGHPTHDMNVIGITGTNGKTTVSYLIAQAFALGSQSRSGLIGTLGYGPFDQISKGPNTTPEPVTLQNVFANMYQDGVDVVAMEVSSHGLDQYRVIGTEFDIAVFTNLSRDHLDYHQTMESYAESKRRLFSDYLIRKAVFNLDDEYGRKLAEEFQNKIEVVGYTLAPGKQYNFPVVAANVVSNDLGGLILEISSPWGKGTLKSDLIGNFNASNLLAPLTVLRLAGVSFSDALASLSRCSSVPGRMESFRQKGMPLIIVDYAHSPEALRQALRALQSQTSGKLICVFGCGGQRDRGKRAEMGQVAEQYAAHIFLTNDNPRNEAAEAIIEDIIDGIKDQSQVTREPDRRKAIRQAIHSASADDVVLIAGKGHEDYQEVEGVRYPLSDRLIVKRAIGESEGGNADD